MGCLLLAAAPVLAQGPDTGVSPGFLELQQKLKVNDTVIVTSEDGSKATGQLIDISTERITLREGSSQRTIPAPQITQVQQRKNGIVLGTVVGALAGVPVGILAGQYAYNEAGDAGAAAIFPIAAGAGNGLAIDAILWKPRTLYSRQPTTRAAVRPLLDGTRRGLSFSITF